MAFSTGFLPDAAPTRAGERLGNSNIIYSESLFESGLFIGRVAQWNDSLGRLENFRGDLTPIPAGVVLNSQGYPMGIERINNTNFDSALPSFVEFLRTGVVTVAAVPGLTILEKYEIVFAHNIVDGNEGKITNVIYTNAKPIGEFIRVIDDNVLSPVYEVQMHMRLG